jgi:hypothetical protein
MDFLKKQCRKMLKNLASLEKELAELHAYADKVGKDIKETRALTGP